MKKQLEAPLSGEVWVVEGESVDQVSIWAVYGNPRLALAAARRFKRRHPSTKFRTENWLVLGPPKTSPLPGVAYVVTNSAPREAYHRILMYSMQRALRYLKQFSRSSKLYPLRVERWEVLGDPEPIDRSRWK